MPHSFNKASARRVYITSTLAAFSIIAPVALITHLFFLQDFTPSMMVGPVVVSLLIGALLGTIQWYRLRLKEQSHLFKILADSSREFSYVQNPAGDYLYISPSALTITGYNAQEFADNPLGMEAIIHIADKAKWAKHLHDLRASKDPAQIELRINTKDREIRWLNHFAQTIYDAEGNVLGIQSSNIDITERKRYESRIMHLAEFDPLTDLPNRRYLTRYMLELTQHPGSNTANFAVLFMDLNRFKYVNDAHGHSFGDRLLKKVAKNLNNACCERSLLARFGGDEFVIITNSFTSLQQLEQQANCLVQHLERSFSIDHHTVNIGASIGIAVYPYDGTTPDELIKNADTAMYKAKNAGLNCQFFRSEMAHQAQTVLSLESQLREAIHQDQIDLYFQPQVSICSGSTIGVEALARWTNAKGEKISPLTFIAIAEETGLIIPLGRKLLARALHQTKTWLGLGLDIVVAINVSPRQFLDKDFVSSTLQLIQEYGVPTRHIEIELTETALLEDRQFTIAKLAQLREAGLSIALDDFGTGHSSLSYLPDLPLHTLKIDRSFVTGMLQNKRHEAVCKSITNLAHDLGLNVVAEGIETASQLEKIREIGCDVGQGYLFSHPMPGPDCSQFLLSTLTSSKVASRRPI